MSIVRYNPFNRYKPVTLDDFLDDFWGRSVSDFLGTDFVNSTPSVNIYESEDGYTIEVAAPGLAKDDFSLELKDDQLIISAKREVTNDENAGKWNRREFGYSSFKRNFHISDEIDQSSIGANYENGILTITLDKKEEAKPKAPTTIEIK